MRIFFDLKPNLKSCIFLGGVGRSGTTWVADVINARNEYRIMFEPFYPNKVGLCRRFRYRQYLRPANADSNYVSVARAILTGKIRNRWVDGYNKRFVVTKRLIKDIRANLMLKWLHVNFPEVRMVILMRHPCAVASSKLKSGWGTHLDEFLAQDDLMADYLGPFTELMETAQGDFEKHIVLWCIENYVPLKQFAPGEAYFAFYENLCVQPEVEFQKLFTYLGLNLDEKSYASFGRPSAMSHSASAVVKGANLIDTWRKDISAQQIQRATEILSQFGLSAIYGNESMPLQDPNGTTACLASRRSHLV